MRKKHKKIVNIADVGMQVVGCPAHLNPKVLVFMGRLAMPNVPITKEEVK
jgi:hypothetical protein